MAMIDLGKLGFDLVLNKNGWKEGWSSADQDVETHQSKWGTFASKMGGAIKTAIVGSVVAIGAAVGAMAVQGVKASLELDDTMAKFKSSTGSTADEVSKVRETIKDLYKVNEDSYEDIAKMAEALHNNMQMNSEEIKKYGQNYLDYAKVTKQGLEESIGAIDDIGDAWGLANDQVIPIMDKLKYSQERYGLSIQDGQNALKGLAASFQGLGMNTDQAIGYLNLFASTGVESSTAMTAFNYALKQVKSPEELQKAVKDIQSTEDATERAKKAVELFGARAGVQMANALKPGTQSIEEMIKSMDGAAGAVEKASKSYDASLKVQLELLKKQLQGLFTDLGDRLAPLVQKFVEWLQENMPKIQEVLTTVFNVIGDAISFVIDLIKNIANIFKKFFTENIQSSDEYKVYMQEFQKWFNDIFESLKEIVSTILSAIQEFWKKHGDEITAIIKPIWEAIKNNISTTMNVIRDVIKLVSALIKGDWDGVWKQIKQIFIDVWTGIKNLVPNLVEAVKAAIEFYFSAFKDVGSKLFNFVWDGMKSVWDGIVSWVTEKVNWLVDKLAFWRSSSSEMNSTVKVNGSHFNGLSYVPYDGYVAQLHEGERVLTKDENIEYSNKNNGINLVQNFYEKNPTPSENARKTKQALRELGYAL